MTSSHPTKDNLPGAVAISADKAATQPNKGAQGKREHRSPSPVEDATDDTQRKQAEEERLRLQASLLDAVGQAVIATDPQGKIIYWNRAAEELYGWSKEEVMGLSILEVTPSEEMLERAEEIMDALRAGRRWSGEFVVKRKDGTTFPAMVTDTPVRDEEGTLAAIIGVSTDITELKQTEELRRSEAKLAEAQRIAHLGNWEWDLNTGQVWWSDETYRIYGFAPGELVPTLETVAKVFHGDDRHLLRAAIDDAFEKGKSYDFEHRIVRPDGEVRWVHRRVEVARGEGEEPLRLFGTVHDITERKALEQRLKHQALHDTLTNLPNRRLFIDRLEQALRRTRRKKGYQVAVLFMDLDNFKVINDSLGHEAGDLLLVVVAERLRRCLRPEDTLARFGGDEFTVLIEDVESPEHTVRVAERIVECFQRPFAVYGRQFFVTASIGIALGEARTKRPEELVRDADAAMYRAKEDSTLNYEIFESSMRERVLGRLELENDLRRALQNEEFKVHYQPIINLLNDEAWGVEALLRWQHPKWGLLDPEQFVPLAEESGLIVPIGRRVLEVACEQAKEWQQRYPRIRPLVTCVNFSVRQLEHPDCVKTIKEILYRSGLEASLLSLDIIETLYIKATMNQSLHLERLKELGVRFSIDDFGTGYSSLSYLKRLPADTLKVDKSFVAGIRKSVEDTAIVQTIIDLAHTLGMKVIAEGVESQGQAGQLKEMGCDLAQGYHFAEPLPSEAASEFFAGYSRT